MTKILAHHPHSHRHECPACDLKAEGLVVTDGPFESACEAIENADFFHWCEDAITYVNSAPSAPRQLEERKMLAFALALRAAKHSRRFAEGVLREANRRVDEPLGSESKLLDIIRKVYSNSSDEWRAFAKAFGLRR